MYHVKRYYKTSLVESVCHFDLYDAECDAAFMILGWGMAPVCGRSASWARENTWMVIENSRGQIVRYDKEGKEI